MPSFDIVSEVNHHELTNAVDQANREVTTRFDFKDSGASFSLEEKAIKLKASNEFQVNQMRDILNNKLAKRSISINCLEEGELEKSLHEARQSLRLKEGIEQDFAKKLIKLIKDSKLKVQASIQGEQVRVTGKKRDDLQEAIALLKSQELDLPLQYVNFRD